MIIEGPFYRLTPTGSLSSRHFNLELLQDIKGKTVRKEFKTAGYGYSLDAAIAAIIRYAVSKKFEDATITLKEYLDEFKRISKKIQEEING